MHKKAKYLDKKKKEPDFTNMNLEERFVLVFVHSSHKEVMIISSNMGGKLQMVHGEGSCVVPVESEKFLAGTDW